MKFLLILFGIIGLNGSKEPMEKDITFAILYNNVPFDTTLKTAWGMSCYIEGFEKNILFDTGGDGEVLLYNMQKLNIEPKSVDLVVLSHIHADHTEGIWELLKLSPQITVYLPSSFPEDFKSRVKSAGAKVIEVRKPIRICKDVQSTGEMGGLFLKEQALVLNTKKGIVVLTGCAHPGIVNIVKKAQKLLKDKVYLVLGGFHLMAYSDDEVKKIVRELKGLGVEKIGPSHCTGGRPIELFHEAWGEDFFNLGCGAILKIND